MDLVDYTESGSGTEAENDFSLHGNLSRHVSYISPSPDSHSNDSQHSMNQSLLREMSFVKGRLEEERDKLKSWEEQLREREKKILCLEQTAWEAHENLASLTSNEVTKRWSEVQESQGRVVSELRGDLREKGQENHRLKNSFNYVRQGNDVLRQQVTDLKNKNERLERDISALQGRVTSLKRQKVESVQTSDTHLTEACVDREAPSSSRSVQAVTSRESKKITSTGLHMQQIQPYSDSLFITLSWLTDSILSPSQSSNLSPVNLSLRVTRLLTSLSELMHSFSSLSANHELVWTRFCYWSLYHYKKEKDTCNSTNSSSTNLYATLRRIGEDCVSNSNRGVHVRRKTTESPDLFLRSSNLEVRLLSCVIVLQTISQADTCSHAYDLLRNELREVRAREILLAYRVIDVLLAHFTSQNKLLLSNSILTLLLLVVDQTPSSLQFSLTLCSDYFFRSSSHLFSEDRLDDALKEKLAVILQRLSKLPHSVKLFERSGLEHSCGELLRRLDPKQTFLKLNIESVLANLSLARHNS